MISMRLMAASAAGLLWAGIAQAEQMTLTYEQAGNAVVALLSLDGHDEAVGEGKETKIIKRPYKINGVTRLIIAKDAARLRDMVQVYRDAKQAELTGGTGKLDERGTEALAVADAAMLKQTQTLELERIKPEDLALDTNPVPPSVLSGLTLLLVEAKP